MFDRWTDRARMVMQLAQQEAQRLNHEYIGTEHVLIGLIKEGKGIGANVMKNLGLDLMIVREAIEKIVQPGPSEIVPTKLPRTPRVAKMIEIANAEAADMNFNYVGTEHILLAMTKLDGGVAHDIMAMHNVTPKRVREEIFGLTGKKDPKALPLTSEMVTKMIIRMQELEREASKENAQAYLRSCSDEELAELGLMRKSQVTMDSTGYTVMVREERYLEGCSPLEIISKHLEINSIPSHLCGVPETANYANYSKIQDELEQFAKVDDTQEFHLVRCPKCELMVEELVATPYRHVCANCAKGE